MAIIRDCEIWFAKLDPKRPNAKYNKKNPTWECQIRTTSKEIKKSWEAMNLSVKAVLPDEGAPYYRVNLRKKSIKEDTEAASPVKVVNGGLEDIDPNTIGNGSIGNIRIFQYEYPKDDKTKGIASVLMGIQITKHIVYKAKARDDDFDMTDTETIDNADMSDDNEEFDDNPAPKAASTPKLGAGVSAKPDAAF